jgi:hypothetical protein
MALAVMAEEAKRCGTEKISSRGARPSLPDNGAVFPSHCRHYHRTMRVRNLFGTMALFTVFTVPYLLHTQYC